MAMVVDLALRGNSKLALGLLIGVSGGVVFGWIAVGQKLSGLLPFFSNLVSIARGYDQEMGLDGLRTLRTRGVLAAGLVIATAIIRGLTTFDAQHRYFGFRRLLLTGWLGALVFL